MLSLIPITLQTESGLRNSEWLTFVFLVGGRKRVAVIDSDLQMSCTLSKPEVGKNNSQ